MPRDDFSASTVRVLAQRAGYLCSVPYCGRLTVGPNDESLSSVSNTGVAAHICAASPGGARYDERMSFADRTAIENGIWVCAIHGREIDNDKASYPVERLRYWKENHERRIHYLQTGFPQGRGFISKISLFNWARIINQISIEFGKITILRGNNAVGKSLICRLVSALWDETFLRRLPKGTGKSGFEVEFFLSDPHTYRVIMENGNFRYFLDGIPSPVLAAPMRVQYLENTFGKFDEFDEDPEGHSFLRNYAAYFGIGLNDLQSLLAHFSEWGGVFARDLKICEPQGTIEVQLTSRPLILPYEALSGAEKTSVDIDLAIYLARFYSKIFPVVLILEQNAFASFDNIMFQRMLSAIQREPFQTIITLYHWKEFSIPQGMPIWELRSKPKDYKGPVEAVLVEN